MTIGIDQSIFSRSSSALGLRMAGKITSASAMIPAASVPNARPAHLGWSGWTPDSPREVQSAGLDEDEFGILLSCYVEFGLVDGGDAIADCNPLPVETTAPWAGAR